MALGKRERERQEELFVVADKLPRSPGHVFFEKLNELLREAGFDAWVEELCGPHYAVVGRPGIPPGTYFRMLLVGYFEGIGSQRGIAWRCSDSLSIRKFLGVPLGQDSPNHSSLTVIRNRLPLEIHAQVFQWILRLAAEKKLLTGKTVGVDSTTLEANAALKSIVRKDTGEGWREFLIRLLRESGQIGPDETPPDDQLRKFDKQRKGKKVSNEEWTSESDPDARITKMKDGTTHLAYKAEHVVDLETEIIVGAEIYPANEADSHTLEDSLNQAQTNLREASSEAQIQDAVADKGYHATETLTEIREHSPIRTYIPEPKGEHQRTWEDKPPEQKKAVYANRQRTNGERGKRLQLLRSERVERSFAHVCETGGARRTWLRGLEKVHKRYLLAAAAHNLGCLMRRLFGIGTPRGLSSLLDLAAAIYLATLALLKLLNAPQRSPNRIHSTRCTPSPSSKTSVVQQAARCVRFSLPANRTKKLQTVSRQQLEKKRRLAR